MRTTPSRGAARLLALAALAAFWVFFAPTQLGGSTIYSATVGSSMAPLFHKGDLAVIRRAQSYRVGDIVLYESPVLHRPVLHRILVIQNDHYFFKGDNNSFVDPGYATSGDLLGKLWFHIPKAGRALSWLGAPLHTALIAGVAVAFLLLGGGAAGTRRRRRRGRRRSAARATPARSRAPMRHAPAHSFFHRPRKSFENIVGGAALLLGVALLVAGFGASKARTLAVTGYQNTGTFSYQAKVIAPNPTYPTGFARSGQPVFLSAFKTISVAFHYRFTSPHVHHIKGTISLKALVASNSTWRNLYTLAARTTFTGDTAAVGGTFDLGSLAALLNKISVESGTLGASYTIDLQPIVHVTGDVDGHPVTSSFSPVLPFTISQTVLALAVAQATAPPGATYAPPSAAATLAAALKPHQPGSIPGLTGNYLLIARYHLAVSSARGLGLGLVAIALLAFVGKFFKPRREVWSAERRIAARYGCVIVDVGSLTNATGPEQPTTDVPDFASLATLAQYCERPILCERRGPLSAYAVEDEGRLYIHRPAASPAVAAAPAAAEAR